MLLFGGNIEVNKKCLVVDEWLKFKVDDNVRSEKVPDKGHVNTVLIHKFRKELDNVLLWHIVRESMSTQEGRMEEIDERVIQVVRQMLSSDPTTAVVTFIIFNLFFYCISLCCYLDL